MIGRLRLAARRSASEDERGPGSTPNQPALARLTAEAEPFDAFASFDWFDESAQWSRPLAQPPPSMPVPPFYRRTDVLAAGAAMSVLLFVGLFGYALTRNGLYSATTKVHPELPVVSAPAIPVIPFPLPSDPVDSPTPTPDAVAEDALPIAVVPETAPAAPATSPSTAVPPTAVAPSPGPSSAPPASARPAKAAVPSSTTASSSAVPAPGSGHFTGVILAVKGDVWTFSLWDGTAMSLQVTANTQLTPKASLLPGPQFVAGQTVAVFYSSAGQALVANHIYVV